MVTLVARLEALLAPRVGHEAMLVEALAAETATRLEGLARALSEPGGTRAEAWLAAFFAPEVVARAGRAPAPDSPPGWYWRQAGQWYVGGGRGAKSGAGRYLHPTLGERLRTALRRHLDDLAAETGDAMALGVARRVGERAIALLERHEQAHLALFLKPKAHVRTDYLISLSLVPPPLRERLWECPAQLAEWREHFGLAVPDTPDAAWLAAHSSLTFDTRHCAPALRDELLASLGDLDEHLDGLLIHGDNLQALRTLQPRFAGAVDCMYLDPPYNKGNASFVYPDRFDDECYQTMLDNRLQAAHPLLSPAGALFQSIDDGEVHRLRALSERVFGAEQFIANVVWQKKYTRANDARHFSDTHDHLLVFARERARLRLGKLPREAKQLAAYRNPDGHPKGPWKSTPLHAKSGADKHFSYTFANGVTWAPPPGTYPRFSRETLAKLDAEGAIHFGPDGRGVPSRKTFLSEAQAGLTPTTLWPHAEVGHTHEAASELKQLFPANPFNNPKPLRLLQRVLDLALPGPAGWVLDYFGGSGTTAHAAIALNRRDGGKRRFVLVEIEPFFDSLLVSRVRKAILAETWQQGRPIAPGGRGYLVQVVRLESLEASYAGLGAGYAYDAAAGRFRLAAAPDAWGFDALETFAALEGLGARRHLAAPPWRGLSGRTPEGERVLALLAERPDAPPPPAEWLSDIARLCLAGADAAAWAGAIAVQPLARTLEARMFGGD